MKVVISSGHGKYIRGASGYIDEVDEARLVVEQVADGLRALGVETTTYHDDVSNDQSENLGRIVDFHNSKTRDLDVSVHFNAYETTSQTDGHRGALCQLGGGGKGRRGLRRDLRGWRLPQSRTEEAHGFGLPE